MPGVVVREVAIASTEEMKRAVVELLNYDDAICRTYEARGVRLTVYVAEWAPGKMAPRLVAGHTPDVCWPGSGWERRIDEEAKCRAFNDILAEGGLRPGALRVFARANVVEYVIYWHQVGEKFDLYGSHGSPPWWAMLADVWHEGWGPAREQRFIRISSNRPLEEVWPLPEFAPVHAALSLLGLAANG